MAWQIQKTESFDKWWKKENVENSNYKYHEQALRDFKNVPLHHNRQACLFKNSSFECWVTRLPDKARKQGKSSGFRTVFIVDIEEEVILLQGIFRRNSLNFKGEGGKHDEPYKQLIKDLAQQFVEVQP